VQVASRGSGTLGNRGPMVIGLLQRDLVAGRGGDPLVQILGAERDAALGGVGALGAAGG
jgi:hypothetical protein